MKTKVTLKTKSQVNRIQTVKSKWKMEKKRRRKMVKRKRIKKSVIKISRKSRRIRSSFRKSSINRLSRYTRGQFRLSF